jgi:protein O-GlcNAc transferase
MRFDMRSGKFWIVLVAFLVVVQLLTLTPLWSQLQQHAPTFVTSILPQPTQHLSETLHLPYDYTKVPLNDQICEDTFGTSYLTKLALRQEPYCDSGSPSRLQCFRTNRTDKLWVSDSLCIAQGVELNRTRENILSLQCDLRNFTEEALAGNDRVKGIQNIADMHSYWFGTGVHDTLYQWQIQKDAKSQCSKQSANNKWFLLARRETNVNIFHKLAELWQATMTMDVVRMAIDPFSELQYLTAEDDVSVEVVFEDDREEPLDDWWTVVTGNKPLRLSQLGSGCYGNVIIPLAGSSSPFWTLLGQDINDQICANTVLINTFVRRLFRHLGIESRRHTVRHPVITIIDRQSTRKLFKIEEYVENLRHKYPGLTINLVDFAAISLHEQVVLVQNTDILVGHHGAGMAHTLFLPDQSSVVEIFPPTFKTAGFGQFSKMRGLTYFALNSMWVGDWEKETNTSSAVDPPPWDEGAWQSQEWVYLREKDFHAYIEAALRSQYFTGVPQE